MAISVTKLDLFLLEEVRAWADAAKADGWEHWPQYAPHEGEDRAVKMKHEGFVASAIMRDDRDKGGGVNPSLHVWAPDGLQVTARHPYSMDSLRAGVRHCKHCKADDVETQRYSFAGRCCEACLPAMRAKHEQGNWTA